MESGRRHIRGSYSANRAEQSVSHLKHRPPPDPPPPLPQSVREDRKLSKELIRHVGYERAKP